MDVFTARRDIDQLKMINVLYMSLRSSYAVFSVINVCKVHLSNVMFQNNSSPLIYSSPLFKMIGINTTVIEGYFSFMLWKEWYTHKNYKLFTISQFKIWDKLQQCQRKLALS